MTVCVFLRLVGFVKSRSNYSIDFINNHYFKVRKRKENVMDWGDTLSKIGIGLLVGFLIVGLTKLAKHKAMSDNRPHGQKEKREKPEEPDS